MRENEVVDRIVPREVYGTTFRSVCIPVEGGTIGISADIEDTRKVLEFIDTLSAVSQKVTAAADEITDKSNEIARSVEEVFLEVKQGNEKRKAMDDIAIANRQLQDIKAIVKEASGKMSSP